MAVLQPKKEPDFSLTLKVRTDDGSFTLTTDDPRTIVRVPEGHVLVLLENRANGEQNHLCVKMGDLKKIKKVIDTMLDAREKYL